MLSELKKYIPDDHSRQVTSKYYLEELFRQDSNIRRVMDLGCGAGDSLDYFREKVPGIKWIGLDQEKSPEVESRTRSDGEFYTFDGTHIPFPDNLFDLIYCHQVFEHVRHPVDLLNEVRRVLRPNGYFVGSTSQLEPSHSYSLWNYIPYGFYLLLEETGLQLIQIRPGIDSLTLIIRHGFHRSRFFSRWFEKESPLNLLISFTGKVKHWRPARINAWKLYFCGQFSFLAHKAE